MPRDDYALRAAHAADRALAFLRAARLYRAAIDLGAPSPEILYARLGQALANAGRGAEAAEAYLQAASLSHGAEATELRRMAAEHFSRAVASSAGSRSCGGCSTTWACATPPRHRPQSRRSCGTRRACGFPA